MDNVVLNSIKCIVDIYNEDFKNTKDYVPVHWTQIETWNFEELKCASSKYIKHYFNTSRFFEKVEFMDHYARTVINLLAELGYPIVFISLGKEANLRMKKQWVEKYFPFAEFVGINSDRYNNKSHIDMGGSIFIEDRRDNLETSNASVKILFGDDYVWNNGWKGEHLWNWYEVGQYFKLFN